MNTPFQSALEPASNSSGLSWVSNYTYGGIAAETPETINDGRLQVTASTHNGDPGRSTTGPIWKRWLPLVGSLTMVTWLISRIPLHDLWSAFRGLNWEILLPFTIVLIAVVYLWDTLCLTWLFSQKNKPLAYPTVLRVRGTSYLFTVINWTFGQGLLAWLLAKVRDIKFTDAVGRCMVMAYVDMMVLFGVGWVGASFSGDDRIRAVPVVCGSAFCGLLGFLILLRVFPDGVLVRLRHSRWGGILDLLDWKFLDLAQLAGLRFAFFSIGIVYLAVALTVCGIHIDHLVVVSVLPIIALLDGLPISVAGLGTRETALLLLLRPEEPAVLVAFCLIWSISILIGRISIGLVNLWHPETARLLALRAKST